MSMIRSAFRPLTVSRRLVSTRAFATRHGNDPDILSKEKARNLKGTQGSSAPLKDTAPGWNEHLASDSEANVKSAPKGKPGKDLQDATVAQTHDHHHSIAGEHGAEAHKAKQNPDRTASEDFVKADRGEKH